MGHVWIKTAALATTLAMAASLGGCNQSMDKAVDSELDRVSAEQASQAAVDLKMSTDFLNHTAKEPGVVTLPSGLMYKVVSSPNPAAAKPSVADTVTVHYEGKLINGTVFDSSYQRNTPAQFPLSRVVEAWQIGIPLMHKGDTFMLYVPAKLGYGGQASPDGLIPANSVLIFKVQLLGIQGK